MNHLPIGFGCLLIFFHLFFCCKSYAMASEICGYHTINGHEILADWLDKGRDFILKIIKNQGQSHPDNSDDTLSQVMANDNNAGQISKLMNKLFPSDDSENKESKRVCIRLIQKILPGRKELPQESSLELSPLPLLDHSSEVKN